MKTAKTSSNKENCILHGISSMALTTATMAANSRCAYIFHDPKKPDALKQLRKF